MEEFYKNRAIEIASELKQKLDIINAFIAGETIQIYLNGKWEDMSTPSWNLNAAGYRIKPKALPFSSMLKFINALSEHTPSNIKDLRIKDKNQIEYLISNINANRTIDVYEAKCCGIRITMSFDSLAKEGYTFIDGMPCGVECED